MNKSDNRWIKLMQIGSRTGCHQRPDRSFFWKEYQFPVCARCTGIIIGEISGIFLLLFGLRLPFWYSGLLLVPMAIDGGLQYIKVFESTNFRRLITGLLGGTAMTFLTWDAFILLFAWASAFFSQNFR